MQRRLIVGLLVLVVILLTGKVPSSVQPSLVATNNTVKRVIDGDTIVLANGKTVRYIGINTPERGEPFFEEATKANKNLVLGKKVRLVKDVSETDKYNRLLRYVYVGKVFVNRNLVRHGFAAASTYPPDVAYQEVFLEAERLARSENKGLWEPVACTMEAKICPDGSSVGRVPPDCEFAPCPKKSL